MSTFRELGSHITANWGEKFRNLAPNNCKLGPILSQSTISFELHAKMAEEIDVEKCNLRNFRRSVTLTLDQVKGFAHAASFAAAQRCLRFLVSLKIVCGENADFHPQRHPHFTGCKICTSADPHITAAFTGYPTGKALILVPCYLSCLFQGI